MNHSVCELWGLVKQMGYAIKASEQDGLKMWGPIKEKYSAYTDHIYEINTKKFEDHIMYESRDDKHDKVTMKIGSQNFDNEIADDHFLIQHFRIAKMNNYRLPLVKVLQIAYNVGQARASLENGKYNNDVVQFYNLHRLGNVETYLEPNDCCRLIPAVLTQSGGVNYKKSCLTQKDVDYKKLYFDKKLEYIEAKKRISKKL